MSENLWPEFDDEQALRSPKTVIEEASAGLGDKTKGIVECYRTNLTIIENEVNVFFSLYAGLLRYHHPFLRAKFAVDPVYPVTVEADKMDDFVANDEDELIAALKAIFNAPSTITTIQRLMSLSEE